MLTSWLAVLGLNGAMAEEPAQPTPEVTPHGELRLRAVGRSDPPLDAHSTQSGGSWWLATRLVAGLRWRPSERVEVMLELEALNGRVAGPPVLTGTTYSLDTFAQPRHRTERWLRVLPRRLNVAYTVPRAGQLRVGADLFSWGTGLLANDGAGDPDFGDARTGSIVARLGLSTSPWHTRPDATLAAKGTSFFASFDTVLRDDQADILSGDTALQGVIGFRLVVPQSADAAPDAAPRVDVGAFGVARWQRDREDAFDPRDRRTTTTVFPVDAYLKLLLSPSRWTDQRVLLEAEGVMIHGRTDRPYLSETLDGAAVQSFGAVARLRYEHDGIGLSVKSEAGFASGDDDPYDAVARTFSFHSDYNVGMLLFEHILPLVSARSADQLADPAFLGTPPPGARFTVSQGGVSNATYLFGVIRYTPPQVPGLDLRIGHLQAWSAGDFVDAYQTARHGGYNTTPGGESGGGGSYGHEVDLGVHYTFSLPRGLSLILGAEGAVFLPGEAFDGLSEEGMPTQGLGRGRLSVRW